MDEETEISKLRAKIRALEAEKKKLEEENCDDIVKAIEKVHKALKTRWILSFEIFFNSEGLKHIPQSIFKYLDLKSLQNCCLVSKEWNELIKNTKHYWCLQLLAFKDCEQHIGEDEEHFGPLRTFEELHPDFTDTFEDICANENISNMKIFVIFLRDYIKSGLLADIFWDDWENDQNKPLAQAVLQDRID